MYIMAKTIMISNDVYDNLKKIKMKGDQSYSEVIRELLQSKNQKTLGNVMKHFGVLKGDKEYDHILKDLEKEWKQWSNRYA